MKTLIYTAMALAGYLLFKEWMVDTVNQVMAQIESLTTISF